MAYWFVGIAVTQHLTESIMGLIPPLICVRIVMVIPTPSALNMIKNKPFKVVMVAIMRKLIIIANVILRKGEMCK